MLHVQSRPSSRFRFVCIAVASFDLQLHSTVGWRHVLRNFFQWGFNPQNSIIGVDERFHLLEIDFVELHFFVEFADRTEVRFFRLTAERHAQTVIFERDLAENQHVI